MGGASKRCKLHVRRHAGTVDSRAVESQVNVISAWSATSEREGYRLNGMPRPAVLRSSCPSLPCPLGCRCTCLIWTCPRLSCKSQPTPSQGHNFMWLRPPQAPWASPPATMSGFQPCTALWRLRGPRYSPFPRRSPCRQVRLLAGSRQLSRRRCVTSSVRVRSRCASFAPAHQWGPVAVACGV